MIRTNHIDFITRGVRILHHINVSVNSGEFTVIVGPNGAGKSTLLHLLAGNRRPTSGSVELEGRILDTWTPKTLARKRAVLTQLPQIPMDMTGRQLVELGRFAYMGEEKRTEASLIAEKAMRQTACFHLASRKVNTLSGGERQRLQLARILAQVHVREESRDPKLILLDEPLTALDVKHQVEILQIIRQRCEAGDATVAVLHDLNLAIQFATSLIFMKNGCVVAQGGPELLTDENLLEEVFDLELSVVHHNGRFGVVPGVYRKAVTLV